MHIRELFNSGSILVFSLILIFSCSPKVLPPVETITNVRDSVVVSYKDSTIYHHKTVNKDYTGLLDTLHIYGEHSSMSAYADTTNFTIKGELEEDPYVEKIVYRDRWKFRDSLVYKEVPVEVPVETIVKVVPLIYKILSIIGLISLLSAIIYIFVKYLKI